MATSSPVILLLVLNLTILESFKRTSKLLYKPYGPLMCRRLCEDSTDVLIFKPEDLSCQRRQQSFQCPVNDRLGNNISKLPFLQALDVCYTDREDVPSSNQLVWTADVIGSKDFIHNHNITLYQACEEGNLCIVHFILSRNVSYINSRDKVGTTPVMAAAANGQVAVFDYLVRKGCDLMAVNNNNVTVLHYACEGGSVDIVKYILSREIINTDRKTKLGLVPVMYAAYCGHISVIKLLQDQSCEMRLTDITGNNILHWACKGGHTDAVKYILNQQIIGIESKGHYGRTPVLFATRYGNAEVVKILKIHHCNLLMVDSFGNSILHLACKCGKASMVKYILLQQKIRINSKDLNGRTPVMVAAKRGHLSIVKLLKDKGCNMKTVDWRGNNILHVACKGGHVAVVKYILSQRIVGINIRQSHGKTPAMIAAEHGHTSVVKLLDGNGNM